MSFRRLIVAAVSVRTWRAMSRVLQYVYDACCPSAITATYDCIKTFELQHVSLSGKSERPSNAAQLLHFHSESHNKCRSEPNTCRVDEQNSVWRLLKRLFLFYFLFFLLFGARAGRLGRSAADWVTALKPNRRCLIWQPLSPCVHEGARQIQLHSHKNTLHVSVCLSQSLRYFGFTPSARICFYPRPRYIRTFLCFSSGIYPPRSFLSFHLQI